VTIRGHLFGGQLAHGQREAGQYLAALQRSAIHLMSGSSRSYVYFCPLKDYALLYKLRLLLGLLGFIIGYKGSEGLHYNG
jgi:hypothetical protein